MKDKETILIQNPSLEDEFENLIGYLERTSFFIENGYDITVPDIEEFQLIKSGKETIESIGYEKLKDLFISQEYSASFYDKSIQQIEKEIEDITVLLKRLEVLKDKWGFNLFPKYTIHLTKYGPGGSYDWENGELLIKVKEDGNFNYRNTVETILHEIIHIGIEECIVEKFKLEHNEKERLVDLLCMNIFSDVLPDYKEQDRSVREIDGYVNLDNLPKNINEYVANFPRN